MKGKKDIQDKFKTVKVHTGQEGDNNLPNDEESVEEGYIRILGL